MTPEYLRALQSAIQASEACAPFVHTNDMPKITAEEARAKDQAIADILNADGFGATTREVEAWRAKRYFVKRLKWRAIVAASNSDSHPARAAAQVGVDLAEDARMMADFADPAAAQMWSAFVFTGLCTQEEADEIISWSVVPSAVVADEVSRAVRGPWGDEG